MAILYFLLDWSLNCAEKFSAQSEMHTNPAQFLYRLFQWKLSATHMLLLFLVFIHANFVMCCDAVMCFVLQLDNVRKQILVTELIVDMTVYL